MKIVFGTERKRELNILNEDSVKLSLKHLDDLDSFEYMTFFDDNDNKILDTSLLLPENKAYMIFNSVHFGPLYKNDKKNAMKQFINYLLYPNNLKYVASAIYFELLGSGIPEYMANELGFYPYHGKNSGELLRLVNKNFEQSIANIPISSQTKYSVLQDYNSLKSQDNNYLNTIRKNLEIAEYALKDFIAEQRVEELIEMKRKDIMHYKEILGINQQEQLNR